MNNIKQHRHFRTHNFTLIEIMIVIVIIGMLASLAVPKIMDNLEKAKVETTKANLMTLKQAVVQYNIDNQEYPAALSDLLAKNSKNGRGYLDQRSLPKDGWDQDFIYTVGGDMGFDIISYGADKQQGGEDFDKDLSCFGEEE